MNTATKLSILSLTLASSLLFAQQAHAVRIEMDYTTANQTIGDVASPDRATVVDSNDNIIQISRYYSSGTVDYGDSSPVASGDMYIRKNDSDGNYLWHRVIGGSGAPYPWEVDIDSNDDIYFAGYYSGTVDFDGTAGTDERTGTVADPYLTKYLANGDYAWTVALDGSATTRIYGMAVDDSDNIYVAIRMTGTVDLDPGAGTVTYATSGSEYDLVVAKYDSSGNYVSHLYIDAITTTHATSTVSTSWLRYIGGTLYIYGTFRGEADFRSSGGDDALVTTPSTGYNVFVTEITGGTTYQQTYTISSDSGGYIEGLTAATDGSIYILPELYGDATVNAADTTNLTYTNPGVAPLIKLNPDGTFAWERSLETYENYGYEVALDSNGNAFVFMTAYLGSSPVTVNFNPQGQDEETLQSELIYITGWKPNGDYHSTQLIKTNDTAATVSSGSGTIQSDDDIVVGFDNTDSTGIVDRSGNAIGSTDSKGTGVAIFDSVPFYEFQNVSSGISILDLTPDDVVDNSDGNAGIPASTPTTLRVYSNSTPVAQFTANTTADMDWSGVAVGTDTVTGKAFVHNLFGSTGVSGTFTMFVPKIAGEEYLGFCPSASNLTEVSSECAGYTVKSAADSDTSIVDINGTDYWQITGVDGSGAESRATDTLAITGIDSRQAAIIAVALISILSVIIMRGSLRDLYLKLKRD